MDDWTLFTGPSGVTETKSSVRRKPLPRIQPVEDRAKVERIESDPPELPEVMPQV